MQKLKNWLNGLSDVLPDLLIGILLYGVVCEAVGLIFVKDRLFYSIGLLTGILCAMGMAVHMAWSLNMALDLGESGAVKKMQLHNLLGSYVNQRGSKHEATSFSYRPSNNSVPP